MKKKGKPVKKISKKKRVPIPKDRPYIKILTATPQQLHYTADELRLKFIEYLKWIDKQGREPNYSGFSVYAHINRNFVKHNTESQVFGGIVDMIRTIIETLLVEKAMRGLNVAYLLNNLFKGDRETLQKNENSENLHPDVRDTLNALIKKNKK